MWQEDALPEENYMYLSHKFMSLPTQAFPEKISMLKVFKARFHSHRHVILLEHVQINPRYLQWFSIQRS